MWSHIISLSLKNKLLVLTGGLVVLLMGYRVFEELPIDVYPDINDPRVTIMTEAPGFAPEEVETLVTFPLESAFNGIPYVKRVRSSSGVGISVIFVEFEWGTDIYRARQLVTERLQAVVPNLPGGVEPPFMTPITSRLGEIIEYALVDDSGKYTAMDLRDIADWIIKFRLKAAGGIAPEGGGQEGGGGCPQEAPAAATPSQEQPGTQGAQHVGAPDVPVVRVEVEALQLGRQADLLEAGSHPAGRFSLPLGG
jgi:HME family heavy-metal exporter